MFLFNRRTFNISELYDEYIRTGSVHRAAKKFRTTGETVRQHLYNSGKTLNRRLWTKLEIQIITNAYRNPSGFDMAALCKKVGKTRAAVTCKAEDLGISYRRGRHIRTQKMRLNYSFR